MSGWIQFILNLLGVSSILSVLIYAGKDVIIERLNNKMRLDYDKKLRDCESKLKVSTDFALATINNKLEIELETKKFRLAPYVEQQFTLYNSLWSDLLKLKILMNTLWSKHSKENRNSFRKQLDKCVESLENGALLIEEEIYNKLMKIFNEFSSFDLDQTTFSQMKDYKANGVPIQNDSLIEIPLRIIKTMDNLCDSIVVVL